MSSRFHRFVPRLEILPDRSLPSVTAAITPDTTILTITGDDAANSITIRDSGQAGGITVVGDGQTFQFDPNFSAIVVNTGLGDDTVEYDLAGAMTANRIITANLGRGADRFTANLADQTLGPNANLDISAYGGQGKDTLVLNARNLSTDAGS